MSETNHLGLARRSFAVALVGVLLVGAFVGLVPEADAHSGDEIYSVWTTTSPTIDGSFLAGEWSDANVVDLSLIAGNDLGSYLYVINNDTHLFVAYDAHGDTTNDVGDAASISFDTDHDGAPTDGGDDQFVILGDGTTVHFNYSSVAADWEVHCQPFDPGLPNHAGLAGAEGFGISPNSAVDHRIYEFSIPFALLNVALGDTIGFFSGSDQVPGVTETGFVRWDTWPVHGIVALFEYGNLVLGATEGVSIAPNFQSRPADAGTVATYDLTITNTGLASDIFDLTGSSTMGWTAAFFDSTWNPLTDNGGSPAIDTGSVTSHTSVDIHIEVIVPMGANPGDSDLRTVIATSSNNISVSSTAILRTGVPVVPIWTDFMEGGPDGWYAPSGANDWEHGVPNWVWGPANASSPVNVWGTNLTGNYTASSNSILISPFIDLATAVTSNMTYYQWYDINGGGNDGGWIEISTDNGETWNLLTPEGGYTDNTVLGMPCFAGSDTSWLPVEINLSSYVGDMILLRYYMWDNAADGIQMAGWYLDNVTVNATYVTAGVRVTPDFQFKSGTASTVVSYALTVENIGSAGSDTFDITTASSMGWTSSFYDINWIPLTDTGGSIDIDTGPIAFGGSKSINVNITIPGAVNPGDVDTTDITFTSVNDPGASDIGTLVTQIPHAMPYSDDMESGINGWIYDGFWHQVFNESMGPPWNISYSPTHSWWYGQDAVGHYDNGVRNLGYLTSPPVDLTIAPTAELEFAYYYETESTGGSFDQRWIEIREGNGPWMGLEQLSGDPMGTWLLKTIDLSPYLGNIIQIRFFFDTINDINNAMQGWYIDDVSVAGVKQRPTVEAWEPGGTPSQVYSIGTLLAVTWTATDDQPMPIDNMNISFGSGVIWDAINGGLYSHVNDGVEIWDTTGAAPGIYYINISAYDSDNQMSYDFGNNTFDLLLPDAIEPGIRDVFVDGMATATYSTCSLPSTVELTATIDDLATGSSLIGGANYTLGPQNWPGVGMSATDGSFNLPIEDVNISIDISGWVVGTYDFYVYGWDSVPNYNGTSAQFATLNIIPDNCAPLIDNIALNGQPTLTILEGAGPVTVAATIDDSTGGNTNIQGANYTISAQMWPGTPMNAVVAPFDNPVEDVDASIDTTTWVVGSYDICVYGSDALGNNNTTGLCTTLIVSTEIEPPEISSVLLDGLDVLNAYVGDRVTLTATIDDSNKGNSAIGGANYTVGIAGWPGMVMFPSDGTFDTPVENVDAVIDTTGWANATYEICVYGWDGNLNYNLTGLCATLTLTVFVEDEPPEIKNVLISGLASLTATQGAIVYLNATVDDTSTGGSNIGGANYTVGMGSWPGLDMLPTDGAFDSIVENVNITIDTTGWANATYEICVYGWDEIPNYNTTSTSCAQLTVQLPIPPDTESPTISNVAAEDPQSPHANMRISADIQDNIEVLEVKVEIMGPDGGILGNFTMTRDIFLPYPYRTIITLDVEGDYIFTIWARDTSDNWASATGGFSYAEEDEPKSFLDEYWWVLVIIVVIVVILLIAVLARRGGKEEEIEPEVEEEVIEEEFTEEEELIEEEELPEEATPAEEPVMEEEESVL
ncbi:MAG: hypothetical protein KAR39_00755 [Thermoplasmata archaeon]|nr:hypothetical protein [Thermoplasmata archaeon]